MQESSPLKLGAAGGICTLLGIGLARFAYTPLIPALVEAHWFSIDQANYLGAVNLLGYLIGAVVAHRATQRFGLHKVLAVNLLVTVASFYACALDWGVYWYGLWRLACGISGAVLVVVGVPAALSRVSSAQRPGTASLVFSGIGLGIAASGTVVPWLIGKGLPATWLTLAALATLLAVWSWYAVWRHLRAPEMTGEAATTSARLPVMAIGLILVAYGLDASGFVPHTLFWVDYIARELGRGLVTGTMFWTALGLGAAVGPFVAGGLARWLGFRPALALALGIKAVAVALPLFSDSSAALLVSSVVVGLLIPGSVALTSGSLIELAPVQRQQQVWGWATVSFALVQAVAGYGMSWGHGLIGSYEPFFAIAASLLVVAMLCAAGAAMRGGVRTG